MLERLPRQLTISLSVLLLSCVIPVLADEQLWDESMRAGEAFFDAGNYDEAVVQYEIALMTAEVTFGEQDPRIAATLNDLADAQVKRHHFWEAFPLYKRALEIRERTLGPEHPDVATTLNNLAVL